MYILITWKNRRSVYRVGGLTEKELLYITNIAYGSIFFRILKKKFGKSPVFYSVNKAKIYARTFEDTEPLFLNFRDFIFPEGNNDT